MYTFLLFLQENTKLLDDFNGYYIFYCVQSLKRFFFYSSESKEDYALKQCNLTFTLLAEIICTLNKFFL